MGQLPPVCVSYCHRAVDVMVIDRDDDSGW